LGRVKRAFWRVATATATSRFYYEASLSGKWHAVAADLRGNFLIVGDERYQLTKFHFHRPSEEYTHGKPYDMGLPLMHKSSNGKVAGVAVLLHAASANATIQQLWQPMPMSEGKEQESRRARDCRRRHSSRGLAAPRRRLLPVHGIADGSALRGGHCLVCAEDSDGNLARADQRLRQTFIRTMCDPFSRCMEAL
jgi:hypothetical protein